VSSGACSGLGFLLCVVDFCRRKCEPCLNSGRLRSTNVSRINIKRTLIFFVLLSLFFYYSISTVFSFSGSLGITSLGPIKFATFSCMQEHRFFPSQPPFLGSCIFWCTSQTNTVFLVGCCMHLRSEAEAHLVLRIKRRPDQVNLRIEHP
jgi:hypothetical protein